MYQIIYLSISENNFNNFRIIIAIHKFFPSSRKTSLLSSLMQKSNVTVRSARGASKDEHELDQEERDVWYIDRAFFGVRRVQFP